MKETVTYSLVSMGVMPAWVAILVWAASLAIIIGLLKSELRTRSGKAKTPSLYVTRLLIVGLLGILLLQPVLFIRKQIDHPAALAVLADRSRSMLRTDAYSTRELLDLASLLRPESLRKRPMFAGAIAATMQGDLPAQEKGRHSVQTIYNQLSQGLPWGNSFNETLQGELSRIADLHARLRGHVDKLTVLETEMRQPADQKSPGTDARDAAAPAETGKAQPAFDEKPFRTVDALLKSVSQLEESLRGIAGQTGNSDELFNLLQQYAAVASAWSEAQAAANQLQDLCDASFWEKISPEARAELSSIGAMKRFPLAENFVQNLLKDPEITKDHEIRLMGWESLDDSTALGETDLFLPLGNAISATVKEAVSGMVLVSDGCQNLPERPGVLRRLKARNIPLITVGIGQQARQDDIAILDFRMNRILLAGAKESVKVILKTSVEKDTPIEVVLDGPTETLTRKQIKADGSEQMSLDLEFKAPADSSGVWKLSVQTENGKDIAPENNAVSFGVTVVGRTLGVLLVAPSPRWDVVQIMQALKQLPCRVDSVFWRTLDKDKQIARGSGQGKIPSNLEQMKKYSLVILDSEPFKGMQPADAALFQDYVRNEGGTILMMTNENGSSYLSDFSPMIPSSGERKRLPDGKVEPGSSSRLYPAVSLSADGTETLGLWRSFPASSCVYPVPGQDVPLLDCDQTPCLSVGFYGRGKIYLMGLGEIFRLRQWEGGRTVNRFLSSLLEDCLQPLFSETKDSVATYPNVPVAGTPLHIVTVSPGGGGKGKITHGDESKEIEFKDNPAGGNAASVFQLPQTGGTFGIDDPRGLKKTVNAVTPISRESIYFNLDADFLKNLAQRGDGLYVPLVNLNDTVKTLKPSVAKDVSFREIQLWNWPVFMILLAALLTIDWVLRRRHGLVL